MLADGTLPAPGVYGIPEQWPHVHAVLEAVGFAPADRTEVVLLADVADLPPAAGPVVRTLGVAGTRFSTTDGYVEIDTGIGGAGTLTGATGWADVGNLEPGTSGPVLFGAAGEWLRLAGIPRLLAYAAPADPDLALLQSCGFRRLTETRRGFSR